MLKEIECEGGVAEKGERESKKGECGERDVSSGRGSQREELNYCERRGSKREGGRGRKNSHI